MILESALKEDIGEGDVTTNILFPKPIKVKARIIAKEEGVMCGLEVAEEVFRTVEKKWIKKQREGYIRVYNRIKDGAKVKKGQVVCVAEGDVRTILAAERTALNFLGHLSGIATLTRKYVDAVRPYEVQIMDTRKTIPGLRELEKYAVRCGGGFNHRMGLFDQVLVKDNHIKTYTYVILSRAKDLKKDSSAATRLQNDMRIGELVRIVRKGIKKEIKIEVEVENLKEFKEALEAGPDIIMLDNMKISAIKNAVAIRNALHTYTLTHLRTKLEVSGGVTLKNVRAIARTGVDMLSIGALTHSARALDFSLEVI